MVTQNDLKIPFFHPKILFLPPFPSLPVPFLAPPPFSSRPISGAARRKAYEEGGIAVRPLQIAPKSPNFTPKLL